MQYTIFKVLTLCFISTMSMVSAQNHYQNTSEGKRGVVQHNNRNKRPENPLRLAAHNTFTDEQHGFTVRRSEDNKTTTILFPGDVALECVQKSELGIEIIAYINSERTDVWHASSRKKFSTVTSTIDPNLGPSELQIAASVLLNQDKTFPVAALCLFRQCPTGSPHLHRMTSLMVSYQGNPPAVVHINGNVLSEWLNKYGRESYQRHVACMLMTMSKELQQQNLRTT